MAGLGLHITKAEWLCFSTPLGCRAPGVLSLLAQNSDPSICIGIPALGEKGLVPPGQGWVPAAQSYHPASAAAGMVLGNVTRAPGLWGWRLGMGTGA